MTDEKRRPDQLVRDAPDYAMFVDTHEGLDGTAPDTAGETGQILPRLRAFLSGLVRRDKPQTP